MLQACANGHTAVLQLLLRCGLPAHLPGLQQQPLHVAAVRGHVWLLPQLLESCGSLEVTDYEGATPLLAAVKARQIGAAIKLAKLGARLSFESAAAEVPLLVAAWEGDLGMT